MSAADDSWFGTGQLRLSAGHGDGGWKMRAGAMPAAAGLRSDHPSLRVSARQRDAGRKMRAADLPVTTGPRSMQVPGWHRAGWRIVPAARRADREKGGYDPQHPDPAAPGHTVPDDADVYPAAADLVLQSDRQWDLHGEQHSVRQHLHSDGRSHARVPAKSLPARHRARVVAAAVHYPCLLY